MKENITKKEDTNLENPVEQELFLAEKLKKLEAENEKLKAENEELKSKLKNREELFLIIAHDLKSPVGTSALLAQILHDQVISNNTTKEQLALHSEMIFQSGQETQELIDNLLEWSRSQQEGIESKIFTTNLANQVTNSIAPLLQNVQGKKIKLENKIPDDVEILADSNMLRTVIRNLVSNAIKFTNIHGNISISCEKKGDKVEIYITDNGIGLSENENKKLFDLNSKISKNGTEGEKGTRIGLYVCKDFVEKMNGTISVESEGKDKGTTFTIVLPVGEKK